MKHQNRIAQRIITAAKQSGGCIYSSPEFKIHSDLRTDLLNRLGADILEITLNATVYMDDNRDVDNVELIVKTSSSIIKSYTFDIETLGQNIGLMIDQLKQGKGQTFKTPEDDWNDYQQSKQGKGQTFKTPEDDWNDYQQSKYDDDWWHDDIA